MINYFLKHKTKKITSSPPGIDDINKSEYIDVGVNLIPIFLSGVITCTASVIKLKKYQEKSKEAIQKNTWHDRAEIMIQKFQEVCN